MTIRMTDLKFRDDNDTAYLPDGTTPISEFDVLSLVRHIFRERSDIDMMPIINGVSMIGSRNEYGHDIFIDVTYSKRGYRATYAGRSGGQVTNVQCYMD